MNNNKQNTNVNQGQQSTYSYYSNILTPSELNMTYDTSPDALQKDINGLTQYMNLLISGNSQASSTGMPLGNKYFVNTNTKCIDSLNNNVDRYMYVDNVLTSNSTQYKGLISTTINSLKAINPLSSMQVFNTSPNLKCEQVTLQTIDNNNNQSSEMHYVATMDIAGINPCNFTSGINQVTNEKCIQGFTTQNNLTENASPIKRCKDPLVQIYYVGLASVGIYILYKFIEKSQ
jgi:hypothetical protein